MFFWTLFDEAKQQEQLSALRAQTEREDFWQDQENSRKVLKEQKAIEDQLASFALLRKNSISLAELIELLEEELDEDYLAEANDDLRNLKKQYDELSTQTLLSGEYDDLGAIVSIHPGAGGTESQDWASMLERMYVRFAQRKNYKLTVLDHQSGDTAGIKSVTMSIEGRNAYGYLKSEKGVHRLVRISPYDSAKRRHTSFASVDVIPMIEEDNTIEISPEDLRIDTYRSGGAGGQHVNKTESAVRITHIPTGVVVACQNERSQRQNKETAMRILTGKLLEILHEEHKEKLSDIQGDYSQIAFGSQIRSYVLHPYTLVKDHRNKVEVGNAEKVLDGEIDEFIQGYLRMQFEQES